MRWRGDKEKADNYIIKEKVRVFVRHHKKKNDTQPDRSWKSSISMWCWCYWLSHGWEWLEVQFLRGGRRSAAASLCQLSMPFSICETLSGRRWGWQANINISTVNLLEHVRQTGMHWKERLHLPCYSSEEKRGLSSILPELGCQTWLPQLGCISQL